MISLAPNPESCRTLTDPEVARLRKQHPDLWRDPSKQCLTCHKREVFRMRECDEVVEVSCDCVAQWRMHRWLLNSGIDTRYQRLSWAHVTAVDSGAMESVVDYLEHATNYVASGRGLTLWATQTGTGKTMLETLAIKSLMSKGHDSYFIQFSEMLDAFTAGWRDEDERNWFIRRVRNAGVLGVDDMGREHKGRLNVAEAMFDTVIRARVAACRPTFISTNYTPAEMLQGYGGNVLSLLSEVNTAVEFPGVDFRPTVALRTAQDARDGIVAPLVVG